LYVRSGQKLGIGNEGGSGKWWGEKLGRGGTNWHRDWGEKNKRKPKGLGEEGTKKEKKSKPVFETSPTLCGGRKSGGPHSRGSTPEKRWHEKLDPKKRRHRGGWGKLSREKEKKKGKSRKDQDNGKGVIKRGGPEKTRGAFRGAQKRGGY